MIKWHAWIDIAMIMIRFEYKQKKGNRISGSYENNYTDFKTPDNYIYFKTPEISAAAALTNTSVTLEH